jgi:membrane protein DedA with SNARE-associated domain
MLHSAVVFASANGARAAGRAMFEFISSYIALVSTWISDFARDYPGWLPAVIFLLAFCESIAILSLLVPATILLIGFGAMVTGQPIWHLVLCAAAGAFLGDWVSYSLGRWLEAPLLTRWPFNREPELIEKGKRFIQRYGFIGLFCGRFIGPMRAIVPLIAGIAKMPFLAFQATNIASALAWSAAMLGGGAAIGEFVRTYFA